MIGAYQLTAITSQSDDHNGRLARQTAENDIGWAYVTIAGKDWAEAVTVVIASENGSPVVRSLEWGRP